MLRINRRKNAHPVLIFSVPGASILFLLGVLQTVTAEEQSTSSHPITEPDRSLVDEGSYLTFFLENDIFSGTDNNYTNGVRLSYLTEGKPAINIPFVQKNLRLFSGAEDSAGWVQDVWGFRNADDIEYSYGFALTQLMFTPDTFDTPVSPPGERPYAGWAGLGFSLHARDNRILNSVEISFGLVGPSSLARESQDLVHEVINEEKFQGWDSQIPDEFTLNITFNQKRRWELIEDAELPFGLEIDGFHETGYALGNFLTDIHLGGLVRLGWHLPVELSDARLTPTAHTQKLYSNGTVNEKEWSVYGLLGLRAAAILHDITLDGPLFKDYDTGVKKENLVGEIYIGFGVRYRSWECGYVHTYRTKQFKTQNDPQWFGSVAIRKRF